MCQASLSAKNDGWGWDGTASCRVETTNETPVVDETTTTDVTWMACEADHDRF